MFLLFLQESKSQSSWGVTTLLANTKLLPTSKHYRQAKATSPWILWNLRILWDSTPSETLRDYMTLLNYGGAFTVLNLRKRLAPRFANIEKCSNPSLSVFPFIRLRADIYLARYVYYWFLSHFEISNGRDNSFGGEGRTFVSSVALICQAFNMLSDNLKAYRL